MTSPLDRLAAVIAEMTEGPWSAEQWPLGVIGIFSLDRPPESRFDLTDNLAAQDRIDKGISCGHHPTDCSCAYDAELAEAKALDALDDAIEETLK